VRNVLVIVLDDIGTDALALYGGALGIETPELEAIAAQGVRFTRCYGAPRCDPARRLMQAGHWWTGGNGPVCSSQGDGHTPQLSEDFLAERLPSHAFALFGKSHLGVSPTGGDSRAMLLEHGFEAFLCGVEGQVGTCGGTGYGISPGQSKVWMRVDAVPGMTSSALTSAYQPDALLSSFLSAWPAAGQQKVAFLCMQLAHEPFHSPPGYSQFLDQTGRYRAMVEYLDAQLPAILAAVNLTRTMVVIVGDNGTPPGPSPAPPGQAKGTTYEGGLRIPLVILGGPVTNGGRVSDELVSIVDLYQTILDWCGGALPPGGAWPIASRSLVPLLEESAYTPREYVIAGDQWTVPGAFDGDRCIVAELGGEFWKLRQLDPSGDGVPDSEVLYHLPDEQTDHLAAEPLIAAALRTTLVAESLP
jgi:arylsulfatase A-like enzyme